MGSAAAFMITGSVTKIMDLGAVKIVLGMKQFFYFYYVIFFGYRFYCKFYNLKILYFTSLRLFVKIFLARKFLRIRKQ